MIRVSFVTLGVLFGYLAEFFVPLPDEIPVVTAIIFPFFVLEIILIEKYSKRYPKLKNLELEGRAFGFFSFGVGLHLIVLLQ